MPTLADVLRLLYGAPSRFTSAAATIRVRYWPLRFKEALTRWATSQPPNSIAILRPTLVPTHDIHQHFVRLWLEPPDRWRYEVGYAEAAPEWTIIVNGSQWWVYGYQNHEVRTNAGTAGALGADASNLRRQDRALVEMLDPHVLIPYLWLDPNSATTLAGHDAILVHGVPREPVVPAESPAVLSVGADSYDLAVDADRGILLHCVAYMGGRVLAEREMLSIIYDEPATPSMFTPTFPSEAALHESSESHPPQIAIL